MKPKPTQNYNMEFCRCYDSYYRNISNCTTLDCMEHAVLTLHRSEDPDLCVCVGMCMCGRRFELCHRLKFMNCVNEYRIKNFSDSLDE
jgi:hypothetical protein